MNDKYQKLMKTKTIWMYIVFETLFNSLSNTINMNVQQIHAAAYTVFLN